MLIYEVTLQVDAGIAADYHAWLQAHVAEMLGLPGFLGADILQVCEPLEPGCVGWCVAYRLRDRAALDAYLAEHAARMRADGMNRVGARFRASRRILQPAPPSA
jgi:antibiotic biosynthesis monooxygenase (ABM) superfamily enzyme